MEKRYLKNMNLMSESDIDVIKTKTIAVVGCGGLGGFNIELLARLGIGNLILIDGDKFDETNLNRQLISTNHNIGKSKSFEAKKRVELINDLVMVTAYEKELTEDNANALLAKADLVIDAVDNIKTKLLIQDCCEVLEIPFVHSAIGGWYLQVISIFPKDRTLDKIYKDTETKGVEEELGNPSFTPSLAASIQVSEALKILLSKGEVLKNKQIYIDLKNNIFDLFDL